MEHTFHTRHDFTPDLGWAAFQLLAEFGADGATIEELTETARALSSPLARRSDLAKLCRSMEELGFVTRSGAKLALSASGRALSTGTGRYAPGFAAAVHCVYVWGWLWAGSNVATPSWSYRQVCREIRRAGAIGIDADGIVLKIVGAADRFGADRVSYSRSSVNGVTAWLREQSPPLIEQVSGRFRPAGHPPGLTCIRYQIGAICRTGGGEAELTGEAGEQVADGLLLAPGELRSVVECALGGGDEFHLLAGATRVAFRGSTDPFLEWIVHGQRR